MDNNIVKFYRYQSYSVASGVKHFLQPKHDRQSQIVVQSRSFCYVYRHFYPQLRRQFKFLNSFLPINVSSTERGIGIVVHLLTKQSNMLRVRNVGDPRLNLIIVEPDLAATFSSNSSGPGRSPKSYNAKFVQIQYIQTG